MYEKCKPFQKKRYIIKKRMREKGGQEQKIVLVETDRWTRQAVSNFTSLFLVLFNSFLSFVSIIQFPFTLHKRNKFWKFNVEKFYIFFFFQKMYDLANTTHHFPSPFSPSHPFIHQIENGIFTYFLCTHTHITTSKNHNSFRFCNS